MKKGILIVSFGTSHLDTLEKTIAAIEREAAVKYADCRVYRAFTSRLIIRKLKKEYGIQTDTVETALNRMAEEGLEDVIVQPTHIINGIENDRMLDEIRGSVRLFQRVRIGKPLLSSADDYKKAVHAVMAQTGVGEDEMLLLMGHGTEHHANAAYPTLEYTFHALGYNNVLVGTAENFPELKNVMACLEISEKKKTVLMPFLLVAGDHAKTDMAGEEDSWKTVLEENGYQVRVVLKGLGELEGIRRIFMEHIREAADF